MNAASPPVSDSVVSNAPCSLETGLKGTADLGRLAIETLEAHPTFRGRLGKCAISIESLGDTLVLKGRVPSWHLKQLLQETLRRVAGVESIENRVVVFHPRSISSTER